MSQDGGEYHRRRRAKLYTCKNCIRHRKEEARVQQREPELRGYQRDHSVQILETPRPREIRFWIGTPVRLVSAGRWIPLMEGGGDMMMLVPLKGESSGHRRPWHPGEGAFFFESDNVHLGSFILAMVQEEASQSPFKCNPLV